MRKLFKLEISALTRKQMEIHSLISKRWSPVAFDSKEVEEEKLQLLFKAAMWAPSSRNAQPWRFIYVTRSDPKYPEAFDLLNDGNRIWAHTAPILAISVAETISTYKGKSNYFASVSYTHLTLPTKRIV